MTDTDANYLRDLGQLLRERGERAKKEAASAAPEDKISNKVA